MSSAGDEGLGRRSPTRVGEWDVWLEKHKTDAKQNNCKVVKGRRQAAASSSDERGRASHARTTKRRCQFQNSPRHESNALHAIAGCILLHSRYVVHATKRLFSLRSKRCVKW